MATKMRYVGKMIYGGFDKDNGVAFRVHPGDVIELGDKTLEQVLEDHPEEWEEAGDDDAVTTDGVERIDTEEWEEAGDDDAVTTDGVERIDTEEEAPESDGDPKRHKGSHRAGKGR